MNIDQKWSQAVGKLEKPIELPTTPTNNRVPRWFMVSCVRDKLVISSALERKPPCRINGPRNISRDQFAEIFPFYSMRLNGEEISNEVAKKTRNQVYIYSIIHYLVEGNAVPAES